MGVQAKLLLLLKRPETDLQTACPRGSMHLLRKSWCKGRKCGPQVLSLLPRPHVLRELVGCGVLMQIRAELQNTPVSLVRQKSRLRLQDQLRLLFVSTTWPLPNCKLQDPCWGAGTMQEMPRNRVLLPLTETAVVLATSPP